VIRLDLGSLPEGRSHQDIEEDAAELEIDLDGGRFSSPVAVSLDLSRNGDEILIDGRVKARIVLECARCLEEYPSTLEAPFNLMVMVGEKGGESGEEDSLVRVPGGAKYVDLTGTVRSELLVRLPLKPLCKEDCRGLCPECGTNLNSGGCSCEPQREDSRWDVLKRFKTDG
jgi:uncharacterized protein